MPIQRDTFVSHKAAGIDAQGHQLAHVFGIDTVCAKNAHGGEAP